MSFKSKLTETFSWACAAISPLCAQTPQEGYLAGKAFSTTVAQKVQNFNKPKT